MLSPICTYRVRVAASLEAFLLSVLLCVSFVSTVSELGYETPTPVPYVACHSSSASLPVSLLHLAIFRRAKEIFFPALRPLLRSSRRSVCPCLISSLTLPHVMSAVILLVRGPFSCRCGCLSLPLCRLLVSEEKIARRQLTASSTRRFLSLC